MAKKKETQETTNRIPLEEIELGGVYKNYVNDIVKVEKIVGDQEKIIFYNISGAHRQWISFKNVFLVEKVYQSR